VPGATTEAAPRQVGPCRRRRIRQVGAVTQWSGRHQNTVTPASGAISWAVINFDSSEARNNAVSATSRGAELGRERLGHATHRELASRVGNHERLPIPVDAGHLILTGINPAPVK
jgi:hypothetical protein